MSWKSRINHTIDGESVRAGVDGRPTRELESRTDYLKDRLEAISAGSAIYRFGATVKSNVKVGHPVFFNETTNQFELAFSETRKNSDSGSISYSDSTFVVGLVTEKSSSTTADILLSGTAELDLTESTGEASPYGPMFLGKTPGALLLGTPEDGPYIGFSDGTGRVYIQISLRDFFSSHDHLRFDLFCKPAGDTEPPINGGRHVIANANDNRTGWLPAAHPIFEDTAPVGAAFGYNLKEHPELNRVWPPSPVDSAAIFWDKGSNLTGGTLVPLGSTGLVIINSDGIWWMSDCVGDVPWPANTTFVSSVSEPEPDHSEGGLECDRIEEMKIVLSFIKHQPASTRFFVNSLVSNNEKLRIVDCLTGQTASTGELRLELDSDFLVEDTNSLLGFAVKSQEGEKLQRGPAITGVTCPDGTISISASNSFVSAGKTYHHGLVSLEIGEEPADRFIPVQVVRLSDVRQRYESDVFYIGFPEDQESEVRVSLKIPYAVAQTSPTLRLRLTILSTINGTTPDLTVTYRIIPRSTTPVTLPSADTALDIDTSEVCLVNQYFEATSDPISVDPGDLVLVSITRTDADSYAGELGLIEIAGVISSS